MPRHLSIRPFETRFREIDGVAEPIGPEAAQNLLSVTSLLGRFPSDLSEFRCGGGTLGKSTGSTIVRLKPLAQKMHVLEGTPLEISMTRRVARPVPPNTILLRGRDAAAPDLVCGSCGAVLVVGVRADHLLIAIACSLCDSVNEPLTQ